MKLIKQGKQFDLSSSTLVAVSQWYMHYDLKRHRLYKSAKGTFFETTEYTTHDDIRKVKAKFFDNKPFWFNITPNRVEISTILTVEKAMDMVDYISAGKPYATQYCKFYYELLIKHEDIFDITEA